MSRTELMLLKLLQFIFLIVIVLAGYSLLRMARVQFDATEEQLVRLSDETVSIVNQLDADKPVRIRAYFSNEVPHELVETRDNLENFLTGIERLSGGKVRVNITWLDANTPAAYDVERLYNIRPRNLMEQGHGNPRQLNVFMGIVFSAGLKERIIPFFERGMSEELELARNIKLVNGEAPVRIGVLGTDAHVWGSFDFQRWREIPAWRFVQELQKQYDVIKLTPEGLRKYYYDGGKELKADDRIAALIVPMASTLTDRELYFLHQYIWTGAPVLILDDPAPTVDFRLAPQLKKIKPDIPGQPPSMGDGPPKGNIEAFFKAMGVDWKSDSSVWATYNPYPILPFSTQHIFFLGRHVPNDTQAAGAAAQNGQPGAFTQCFSTTDETASHLQELLMFLPGGFSKAADAPQAIELTPLLTSPLPSGTHRVRDIVPQAFPPEPGQPDDPPQLSFFSNSQEPIVLAARITGHMRNAYLGGMPPTVGDSAAAQDPDAAKYADPAKQPSAGGDNLSAASINVIFIPDIDMISDQFFDLRDQMPDFGGITLDLDNTRFVLNCVDSLAKDETFLHLRNRRPVHRPMERMDSFRNALLKDTAEQFNQAKDTVDQEIKAANKRLADKRAAIEARPDLDQAAKNAKLQKDWKGEEANTKKHIEELRQNLTRKQTELERDSRTRIEQVRLLVLIWPIVIPVVLLLALGAIVFGVKVSREHTDIPSARKRN